MTDDNKLHPRESYTFDDDKVDVLRAIAPEAFADGEINWDVLREALGDYLEDDTIEHFGLSWPGKRAARRRASYPSSGTLIPVEGAGVNEDETHNIFIEADNLEALKLLQKSYAGRIKMIYIDPPYNTGGDFVYRDDFKETTESFMESTGQVSETGARLTSNPKTSGRFHTNWLNMMYPRLRLARTLLRDDGAIFVSIDDNEVHHLRNMMDEIFGEANFINQVAVKTKPSAGASGGGEDKRLKKNMEFLLIYVFNRDSEPPALNLLSARETTDLIEHITEMRNEGKSWKYTRALLSKGTRNYVSSILDGSGQEIKIYEHSNYQFSPLSQLIKSRANSAKISQEEAERQVYYEHVNQILRDTNAQSSIRHRVMDELGKKDGLFSIEYIPRSGRNKGQMTTVYYVGEKKNQIAWLSDIASVDGDSVVMYSKISTLWDSFNWNNVAHEGNMSFPDGKKPIEFIQQMLDLATFSEDDDNHIILDFFAGSGSTGHAVMAKNKEDNGNRQFILVQLPETPQKDIEFDTISDLSIERLRRSIKELTGEGGQKELFNDTDLGFKVYRYASSHYRPWQDYEGNNIEEVKNLFNQSPLVDNWKSENLLTEILLLNGFPLDSRVEIVDRYKSNAVHRVNSDFHAHVLHVCLDEKVRDETINTLDLDADDIFVCLDSALTDESKFRLRDRCNLRVI